jgi:hypothetical protein
MIFGSSFHGRQALQLTVFGLTMWLILAQMFNRINAIKPCTNVS